jgi:acid phosphatase (class A)
MRRFSVLILAAALLGCATVPAVVGPAPRNAAGFAEGYLAVDADARVILPAPPAVDSALQAGELATVVALRAPRDEARWAQAISDNRVDPGLAFAAPLGLTISEETTPSLAHVLARVVTDIADAYDPAKEHFGRMRPFQTDPAIETCIANDAAQMARLANSRSYPSGHAGFGWGWGLLLAEMVPERADAILERGYQYGWSRVVCGVHYPSDVDAGRAVAAAVVARLHADPAFARDFAIARAELRGALGLE